MLTITFNAKPHKIGTWTILQLPKSASAKLPTRGMIMVEGTMNGIRFTAPLEPDGKGGHWLKVNTTMRDTVTVKITPIKEWPEPKVPLDLKKALATTPHAHTVWKDITPSARWDWIRWIRSTKQQETRKRRIEVAISKLKGGDRRPCCFNRNMCTEPDVSNNGKLIEPN
ncbi:DUF1905 domain-containing protein [Candidatus Woesearchaeota archaeon]|nr:DUF1905 domain-containing protein [Candidatus Woesearchaeota archaeon]